MAMNYPYPTSSPTSSGAYTTGIRSALKQKGISDEQITYDPNKGVMVGGTPFIRPEKNYAGTTYTSPSNFQSAWDTYSKSLNQPQPGAGATGSSQPGAWNMPFDQQARAAGTTIMGLTPTGPTAGVTQPTMPGVQPSPINEQINKIIQGLQSYGQNQPAFDPYSSAAYQAAQAQTQRQTQQGIRQAQEAYGSAGFGRSTGLGERAQRIGQEGTEYLMTQVIPQIQAQEQARKQQEFQNTIAALTPLLGQQSREDLLRQQDISNRVAESGVTGTYVPQGSQDIINQLLGLKQQAETAGAGGATAETMGQFRSQGDVLRNQLASLGYDISGLGAETSAADVRAPRGVQTQTARQFEQTAQQNKEELAYKQARDKIADEQYKQKFDEDVRQFGLNYAADEAYKNRQLSQADARIGLEQAQETRLASTPSKASEKAAKEAESGGPKVSSAQFNDAFKTLQQKYGVARYKETTDAKGKKVFDESAPPTYTNTQNPDQQSKLVIDVLNLGLNDEQTLQMWNKLGVTEELARELLGG